MTYALSKKTVLGVATESAYGTARATPTLYVPTKHTYKRVVKKQYITDDRGVRDDNNDVVTLVYEGKHTLKGEFYADTSPYFLIAALGADTPTQPDVTHAPTAYNHAIRLADLPPTLDLFKSYQTEKYLMDFAVLDKFTVKYDAEKTLEFDCDLTSNAHGIYGGAWSPSISTVHPMAGASAVIKVGGGSASLDVANIEIDFEQVWTLYYNGSSDYIAAYPGGRKVKFKFDARFDTATIYDRFVANSTDSLELTVTGVNLGTVGNPTLQTFHCLLPLTSYDTMDHDTTKANVMIKAAGTAMPGGSPTDLIQIDVINTVASYAS